MIMMMHFVIMKKFNILLMKIIVCDIVFFCDVSNYVAFDDHDDELTSVQTDHVQKSTGWTTTVGRQAAALTQTWYGLHQIFGPRVYFHQLDSLQIKKSLKVVNTIKVWKRKSKQKKMHDYFLSTIAIKKNNLLFSSFELP